jgi:serine/threonine protein kinase
LFPPFYCISSHNAFLQMSNKSDMWSIGVILYQMLFGRNPYSWVLLKFQDLEEPERTEKTDEELRKVIFEGQSSFEFDEYEDRPLLEMLKARG